jgi:3-oxoacyl-[acyl-carrier protein] reductase
MKKRDWDDVISTNLSGAFNLIKPALTVFLKQKSGNIINVSSIAGTIGMPKQVNHSTGKAGILGLTKALAKEVGPYNIRVNAIAPGFIYTDMIKNFSEKRKAALFEKIPLGRFGEPEEIAKLAAFLVSDKAEYITGQVITADGGLTM